LSDLRYLPNVLKMRKLEKNISVHEIFQAKKFSKYYDTVCLTKLLIVDDAKLTLTAHAGAMGSKHVSAMTY